MENSNISLQSKQLSFSDFEKEKSIGLGGYGEVFLAKHKSINSKIALKVLYTKELTDKDGIYFYNEVLSLLKIKNTFIVNLIGYSNVFPYFIATEYIQCGTLYDALVHKPRAPKLDNTQKTLIAMGIAYGMITVHQAGIIHRDLKSSNILLDENYLPKISDFGLCLIDYRNYENNNFVQKVQQIQEKMKTKNDTKIIGTPCCMPPEMYDGIEYCTNKVDVYEYGILLWEMITEKTPFKNMDPLSIMTAVAIQNKRPNIPSNISSSMKKLIESCWDRESENRPSFEQIYDSFSKKEVYFPQTNLHKVDAMTEYVCKKKQK